MRHDILDQMPSTLLQSVRRHLEVIHDCNADVLRARALERQCGSPGRSEWAWRLARASQAQHRLARPVCCSGRHARHHGPGRLRSPGGVSHTTALVSSGGRVAPLRTSRETQCCNIRVPCARSSPVGDT